MVVHSLGMGLICLPKDHTAVCRAAEEVVATRGEMHVPYSPLVTSIGAEANFESETP
jgi:hypothetical protein